MLEILNNTGFNLGLLVIVSEFADSVNDSGPYNLLNCNGLNRLQRAMILTANDIDI